MPRTQLVLVPTALEQIIADDHPVRLVDEILDTLDWTEYEAAYHGRRGQPPIHPSVLAKVLLFAMIRKLHSSRQIEYQLKHSIDFMWLASGRRIDHTTLPYPDLGVSECLAGKWSAWRPSPSCC